MNAFLSKKLTELENRAETIALERRNARGSANQWDPSKLTPDEAADLETLIAKARVPGAPTGRWVQPTEQYDLNRLAEEERDRLDTYLITCRIAQEPGA